jgi:hypothetical protein
MKNLTNLRICFKKVSIADENSELLLSEMGEMVLMENLSICYLNEWAVQIVRKLMYILLDELC